ncbi:uncharacterized protein LOC110441422 isoform X1 [Mizuhopecten yessoensis]|uniref:uncharacterized protein LOC110441422 isoform X1 n=1 Tax=Mizuhopecten yessoensis TaxID=6573 RepID=UPI000B45EF15|nr:uncharacterized protein LOC110441422 isoform X1 [Mizuhopecten yessoensis]XP_021340222.1 uncharacterized protein LOC110441422 isoform X1 [Mizuhopecten yessoensis]XP_021340223.1 uncharacterized protein LOC110441422 isoform X1 [Mizuhopecten yessoensis]XP_021340224.1 uncharacterized protein LOC110441422 isoform X1 [Mizuhopecten yessoensis]
MNKKGYKYTPTQCENKFKSLKREYRNTVDHNSKSGNDKKSCPFFSEFQELYGMNASTRPSVAISSSRGMTMEGNSTETNQTSQTPSKTRRDRKRKERPEWLENLDTRIISLPQTILMEVLRHLNITDQLCLASTSRGMRRNILGTFTNINVSCKQTPRSVPDFHFLNIICSLTKLVIRAKANTTMLSLLSALYSGALFQLEILELIDVGYSLQSLYNVIIALPNLHSLVTHESRSELSVEFLVELMQRKKGLRYVSGKVTTKCQRDVENLAQLLNSNVGRVTFGHSIIDKVPLQMLKCVRYAYSFPNPSGRY